MNEDEVERIAAPRSVLFMLEKVQRVNEVIVESVGRVVSVNGQVSYESDVQTVFEEKELEKEV